MRGEASVQKLCLIQSDDAVHYTADVRFKASANCVREIRNVWRTEVAQSSRRIDGTRVASERVDYCGCAPGGGAACPSAALARLRGGCVIKVSMRSTLDEHAEQRGSVCSPQALVLELQGLDALPLLLLLRLHLRHEARVDHEACAARARPAVSCLERQQGAHTAAGNARRCTGAGHAPAGWPLEVTAMTLWRGGRYSEAATWR